MSAFSLRLEIKTWLISYKRKREVAKAMATRIIKMVAIDNSPSRVKFSQADLKTLFSIINIRN